ncbi:voltage-gated potassium channel [compost metagenome]
MNAAQGIIILIVKGIREAIIWSCLRLSRDFERGHKLREKRVLKALVSRKAHIVFQVVAIIAYALASAFLFSIFEHWSYIDSFYFTFVTLATIGYGDYTPQTFGGRVFFCLFVLIGFGMLAILVGMIGKYAIEKMQERIEKIKMQSRVAFEMLEKLKNSGPLVIGPNGEEMRRPRLSLDLPRPRLSIDFPSMMKRSPSLALFDKVTGYS